MTDHRSERRRRHSSVFIPVSSVQDGRGIAQASSGVACGSDVLFRIVAGAEDKRNAENEAKTKVGRRPDVVTRNSRSGAFVGPGGYFLCCASVRSGKAQVRGDRGQSRSDHRWETRRSVNPAVRKGKNRSPRRARFSILGCFPCSYSESQKSVSERQHRRDFKRAQLRYAVV